MPDLTGKTVLIAIPKNQFDEQELFGTRDPLTDAGARVVVLSKNGTEATGSQKTRYQPNGRIVDWDKENTSGKYDAVLVMGGRGAPKFLWDDSILPQILTDHYRAGKILGGIGLGVAVLARANLLSSEAAGPEDEKFLHELQSAGIAHTPDPVADNGTTITARDGQQAGKFAQAVIQALARDNSNERSTG